MLTYWGLQRPFSVDVPALFGMYAVQIWILRTILGQLVRHCDYSHSVLGYLNWSWPIAKLGSSSMNKSDIVRDDGKYFRTDLILMNFTPIPLLMWPCATPCICLMTKSS